MAKVTLGKRQDSWLRLPQGEHEVRAAPGLCCLHSPLGTPFKEPAWLPRPQHWASHVWPALPL